MWRWGGVRLGSAWLLGGWGEGWARQEEEMCPETLGGGGSWAKESWAPVLPATDLEAVPALSLPPPGLSFPRCREDRQIIHLLRAPDPPEPPTVFQAATATGPDSDPSGQAPEGAATGPHLHRVHHGLGLLSCGAVDGGGGRGQLSHGAARALWEGSTRLSSPSRGPGGGHRCDQH